jgi:hypothetical protein
MLGIFRAFFLTKIQPQRIKIKNCLFKEINKHLEYKLCAYSYFRNRFCKFRIQHFL